MTVLEAMARAVYEAERGRYARCGFPWPDGMHWDDYEVHARAALAAAEAHGWVMCPKELTEGCRLMYKVPVGNK